MSKTCPVCSTVYPDADAFCPKDGTTLRTDEAAATLVGSVIADRYLVSKLLGEGGMGQVYLAGHVRLPQQAAIKVLHSSMVKDAAAIARFNREAANAARIEHERVARVFDFGETSNGLVYLAMEFVPGRTLTEVLQEAGRLSAERAANIVYQVADGLEAAHRISIVHRDLKPDNILVVSDESGADRCKVVDFGIAKAFDDSGSGKTQLTQVGAIIGTPEFMSPEQVLGEHLDARSDVYALAVVAYQLLTGSLPFVAATPERSLTMRLIQDPSPLSETAPDVEWPSALQETFDRGLAREPAERTPSALQFAEELIAATEGWTGAVVLRGRTPMSSASLSAARTAGGSSMRTAVNAFRNAPTMAIENKALPGGATKGSAGSAVSAGSAGSGRAVPGATDTKGSKMPMIAGAMLVMALVVGGGLYASRDSAPDVGGDSMAQQSAAEAASRVDASTGNGATVDAATKSGTGTPDNAAANQGTVAPAAGVAVRDERTGATSPEANNQLGASSTAEQGAASGRTSAVPESPGGNAIGTAASTAAASRAAAERDFSAIKARLNVAADRAARLDEPAELTVVARQEIPRLQALLPLYATAADSVRVYVALVVPYASVEDEVGACSALRTANRLATSREEITVVAGLKSAFANCL